MTTDEFACEAFNVRDNATSNNTVYHRIQVGEKVRVDVNNPIKSFIANGGVVRVPPHLHQPTNSAIRCTQETISRILKPHTYLKRTMNH